MSLLPDNLALSAGDTLLMVVPMCHANACAFRPSPCSDAGLQHWPLSSARQYR